MRRETQSGASGRNTRAIGLEMRWLRRWKIDGERIQGGEGARYGGQHIETRG